MPEPIKPQNRDDGLSEDFFFSLSTAFHTFSFKTIIGSIVNIALTSQLILCLETMMVTCEDYALKLYSVANEC